jgi:hypothetical protein
MEAVKKSSAVKGHYIVILYIILYYIIGFVPGGTGTTILNNNKCHTTLKTHHALTNTEHNTHKICDTLRTMNTDKYN